MREKQKLLLPSLLTKGKSLKVGKQIAYTGANDTANMFLLYTGFGSLIFGLAFLVVYYSKIRNRQNKIYRHHQ